MTLNITDAVFSRAHHEPQAPAVIDADRTFDYRTLCCAVLLAAQRFRQAGWRPDARVAIAVRTSPLLHLVSALALARMGVIQVCVPSTEEGPLRRARIERLGVTGMVTDDPAAPGGGITTMVVPEADWLTRAAGREPVQDPREPGGERLFVIRETSGTTATPKLIGITHADEEIHMRRISSVVGFLPGERFVSLIDLRFFVALRDACRCLAAGATLALPPAGLDTAGLLDWLDTRRIGYVSCVPVHLYQFLRAARGSTPRLPALRILRSGTSTLPVSAVHEVRRRISPNLYLSFGVAEAGTVAVATPAMLDVAPDTIGRPLGDLRFDLVDDADRPVADGALGHVRLRGEGVVAAYLGPTSTTQAGAFRNGWFYPGDLAVRNAAGLIFHKGRSDEVMNFDGILVGPAEIESGLREHPAIVDAAAFALPSDEHQEIPAAALVSRQPLDLDEMARYCAQRLGTSAPRILLQVESIPRNAMGKTLRRELAQAVAQKMREQGTQW